MKYVISFSLWLFIALQAIAQHSNVLFTGRFDFSNPDVPSFSHVSTSIKARFQGSGIDVRLAAQKGTSYLYVIIDGQADPQNRQVLTIKNSEATTYTLAENLPEGPHEVELVKLNQYDTQVQFHGFQVRHGELLEKPERPGLSLEFYGDSNPAGHSAWDPYDQGATADNGGYYTYPGITARLLGAEYINISMGGSGITDKAWYNLIDKHHLIHMDAPTTRSNIWDFENNHLLFQPDAVIINLGANDYYGEATPQEIKTNWKHFITHHLRSYYPHTHIVLANSYGWAYNEPADYVHEAVNELHARGDSAVSFVRFPWLWGQEHAIVNEHAGFANILAQHLAQVLHLPQPDSSALSSFAPRGEMTNGSFETHTIMPFADGWRPHGEAVELVTEATDAFDGHNYLRISNTSWANFAVHPNEEKQVTVSARVRHAGGSSQLGKLKIEFKDQAQQTLATNEGLFSASSDWRQATTTATVPEGTWAIWVVLVAESGATIDFDAISLGLDVSSTGFRHSAPHMPQAPVWYPNPGNGHFMYSQHNRAIQGPLQVYDAAGRLNQRVQVQPQTRQIHFSPALRPGYYTLQWQSQAGYGQQQVVVQ